MYPELFFEVWRGKIIWRIKHPGNMAGLNCWMIVGGNGGSETAKGVVLDKKGYKVGRWKVEWTGRRYISKPAACNLDDEELFSQTVPETTKIKL